MLEGVEGGGKTTQSALLGKWLESRGVAHVRTREPGGTEVGEAIRRILLDHAELSIPPETELLLMLAARSALVRELVRPRLAEGISVLSERFALSTLAYQGYGRGLELEEIGRLNDLATGGLEPDLYLVLDLEVEQGLARKRLEGKGTDRIEGAGRSFLERVREGYRTLAEVNPRTRLLDASASPDRVHRLVGEALLQRFPETFSLSGV